jgi:beta-galactosidase
MNHKFVVLITLLIIAPSQYAAIPVGQEFSTAGFFKIDNSGREVYNFNVGWRFYKVLPIRQNSQNSMIRNGPL